jgi:hypothetical protein
LTCWLRQQAGPLQRPRPSRHVQAQVACCVSLSNPPAGQAAHIRSHSHDTSQLATTSHQPQSKREKLPAESDGTKHSIGVRVQPPISHCNNHHPRGSNRGEVRHLRSDQTRQSFEWKPKPRVNGLETRTRKLDYARFPMPGLPLPPTPFLIVFNNAPS